MCVRFFFTFRNSAQRAAGVIAPLPAPPSAQDRLSPARTPHGPRALSAAVRVGLSF